ncbi:MAG: Fe-S oxidoreductase, partial [Bacteroidota bacterium]
MTHLPQILFSILLLVAGFVFYKRFSAIVQVIQLGREEQLNDQPRERWKNVLLLALGQKKMFKNPLVAILHLIIYVGFIIINIELLEIVLDGVSGN